MSKLPRHQQQGYTLIETLVAITMIVFATVGPLVLAGKSLGESYYARDQIIAYYLAQEGMEMVRAARDTEGATWLSNPQVRNCTNGNTCDVDATVIGAFTTVLCLGPDPVNETAKCKRLMQYATASSGSLQDGLIYAPEDSFVSSRPTGVTSKFSRDITIVPRVDNSAENTVVVVVRWKNGILPRVVRIEENIFTP